MSSRRRGQAVGRLVRPCHSLEYHPGYVPLERSDRLGLALALGPFLLDVVPGRGVHPDLGDGDPVNRGVQLPVTAAVEPLAVPRPGGSWDRSSARITSEVALGGEATYLGGLGDDLGRGERRAPGDLEQRRRVRAHKPSAPSLELVGAPGDLPAPG